MFSNGLLQNKRKIQTEWTITSFDLVLGLIGGFVGLIWDSLGFLLGNYESFKFNTAIIN